jgi:hypothetical protein
MVQYSDDALGERICSLAAHIDAALCEWLELVAEYDRREAWGDWGMQSCAHWLAWTCALSLRTAREHVRIAHRLAEFPLTADAFRRGKLSYSKVRAITRVEDVSQEADLVELARAASAAQLDRIISSHARCIRAERPDIRRRFVTLDPDDDGTWVLRGRLGAEEAGVVNEALAAVRRFAEEPLMASEDGSAEPPALEDQESRPSVGERTADALVAMAGAALAGGSAERAAVARPEVTWSSWILRHSPSTAMPPADAKLRAAPQWLPRRHAVCAVTRASWCPRSATARCWTSDAGAARSPPR